MCDQISDAILDAYLQEDPNARVACETLVKTDLVVIAGEITSSAQPNLEKVIREVINEIGYDNDDKMVLEYKLVEDGKYSDSKNILHNLGKFYYLSATQLLYAFKFYANS